LQAAWNYQAFFRGEQTADADAAGIEFAEFVALQIAFVRAHKAR